MSDVEYAAAHDNPLGHLTLERAISLRWALRDVLAGRTKFLPLADADRQLLVEMGLVEMHDDEPKLTEAGLRSDRVDAAVARLALVGFACARPTLRPQPVSTPRSMRDRPCRAA